MLVGGETKVIFDTSRESDVAAAMHEQGHTNNMNGGYAAAAAAAAPAAQTIVKNGDGNMPSGSDMSRVRNNMDTESDEEDAAEAARNLATLNRAPAAAALAAMEAEAQTDYPAMHQQHRQLQQENGQGGTDDDDSSGDSEGEEPDFRWQGEVEVVEAPARHCDACNAAPKRTTVCCRQCWREYHPGCAGFNPAARLYPPPQWHCPNCEGGTRGPAKLHAHFEGRGIEVHGDQPWCPICFQDNRREVTKAEAKGGRKWRACPGAEHCPGCNLITHPKCVAKLPRNRDGMWPCPECKLRRLNRPHLIGDRGGGYSRGTVGILKASPKKSGWASWRSSLSLQACSPRNEHGGCPPRDEHGGGPPRDEHGRVPPSGEHGGVPPRDGHGEGPCSESLRSTCVSIPPPSFKKRLAAKARAGAAGELSNGNGNINQISSIRGRTAISVESSPDVHGYGIADPKRSPELSTMQEVESHQGNAGNPQVKSSSPLGSTGMGNRLTVGLPDTTTFEAPPKRGRGRPRLDSYPLDSPYTGRNGYKGSGSRGRLSGGGGSSSSSQYSPRHDAHLSLIKQAVGDRAPATVAAARKDPKVAELLAAAQAITTPGLLPYRKAAAKAARALELASSTGQDRGGETAAHGHVGAGREGESSKLTQHRGSPSGGDCGHHGESLRPVNRQSATRQAAVGLRVPVGIVTPVTVDVTCAKCKREGKRKSSKTCSSCNRSWHFACATGSWCTGTGEWVGGWRCRNCLNEWEREIKERTAVVVTAWAEHQKMRERNAAVYAANAAEAAAEAKELGNYGFLVGDVEVPPIEHPPAGVLPFLDVESIRDTGFRLARFSRDDCCFMGPEGIAAKVDVCWKHRIFAVIEGAFEEQRQPLMEFLASRKALPCKISGKASTGEASSTMGDYMQKLGVADKANKPTKDNPGTFFLDTAQGQVEGLEWLSKDLLLKDLMPESARGGLKDHLLGDRCKFGPFTFGGGRNYPLMERDTAADSVGRVSQRQYMQGMDRKRIGGSTAHMDGMGSFTAIGGIKAGEKSVTAFETQDCATALAVARFKSFAKPGGSSYVVNPRIDDDSTLRGRFADAGVRFFTFPIRAGDAYLVPSGSLHEFMNVVPCLSVAWNIMPHPANCKVAMAMAEKSAEEAETVLGVDTERSQSAIEHAPPEPMRERQAAHIIKSVVAHRILLKRRKLRQPSIVVPLNLSNQCEAAIPPRDDKTAADEANALLDNLSSSIRKSVLFARPSADHYMYAVETDASRRSIVCGNPAVVAAALARSALTPTALRSPVTVGTSATVSPQDRQALLRVPDSPAQPSLLSPGSAPGGGSSAMLHPHTTTLTGGNLKPGAAAAGHPPPPPASDMLGRLPDRPGDNALRRDIGVSATHEETPARARLRGDAKVRLDASSQPTGNCDRVVARAGNGASDGMGCAGNGKMGCAIPEVSSGCSGGFSSGGEGGVDDQACDGGVAFHQDGGDGGVDDGGGWEGTKDVVRQVIRRGSNVVREAVRIGKAEPSGEDQRQTINDTGPNAGDVDTDTSDGSSEGTPPLPRRKGDGKGEKGLEERARACVREEDYAGNSHREEGQVEGVVTDSAPIVHGRRRRRVQTASSDDGDTGVILACRPKYTESSNKNQEDENADSSKSTDSGPAASWPAVPKKRIKNMGREQRSPLGDDSESGSDDSTIRHKSRLQKISVGEDGVGFAASSEDASCARTAKESCGLRIKSEIRVEPAAYAATPALERSKSGCSPRGWQARAETVSTKSGPDASSQKKDEPVAAVKKSDYRIPKKNPSRSSSPRTSSLGIEIRGDVLRNQGVRGDKGREGGTPSISGECIRRGLCYTQGGWRSIGSDGGVNRNGGSSSPRGFRVDASAGIEKGVGEVSTVPNSSENGQNGDSEGARPSWREEGWGSGRGRIDSDRSDSRSSVSQRSSVENSRSIGDLRRAVDLRLSLPSRSSSGERGGERRRDGRARLERSTSSTRSAKEWVENDSSGIVRRRDGGHETSRPRSREESRGDGRAGDGYRRSDSFGNPRRPRSGEMSRDDCQRARDKWDRGTRDERVSDDERNRRLGSQGRDRIDGVDRPKIPGSGRFSGDGRVKLRREDRERFSGLGRDIRDRSDSCGDRLTGYGREIIGSPRSRSSQRSTAHDRGERSRQDDSRGVPRPREAEHTGRRARRASLDRSSSSSSSSGGRTSISRCVAGKRRPSLDSQENRHGCREVQRPQSSEDEHNLRREADHGDWRKDSGSGSDGTELSRSASREEEYQACGRRGADDLLPSAHSLYTREEQVHPARRKPNDADDQGDSDADSAFGAANDQGRSSSLEDRRRHSSRDEEIEESDKPSSLIVHGRELSSPDTEHSTLPSHAAHAAEKGPIEDDTIGDRGSNARAAGERNVVAGDFTSGSGPAFDRMACRQSGLNADRSGYHAAHPVRSTLAWNPRPVEDEPPRRRTEGGALHNLRGQRERDVGDGARESGRASSPRERRLGTAEIERSCSSEKKKSDPKQQPATRATEEGFGNDDARVLASLRDGSRQGGKRSDDGGRYDRDDSSAHSHSNYSAAADDGAGPNRSRDSQQQSVVQTDSADYRGRTNIARPERGDYKHNYRSGTGAPPPKTRALRTDACGAEHRHHGGALRATGGNAMSTQNRGGGRSVTASVGNVGGSSPRAPLPKKKRPLMAIDQGDKQREPESRNKLCKREKYGKSAVERRMPLSVSSSATVAIDTRSSVPVATPSARGVEECPRVVPRDGGRYEGLRVSSNEGRRSRRDGQGGGSLQDRESAEYVKRRERSDTSGGLSPLHAQTDAAATNTQTTNARQAAGIGQRRGYRDSEGGPRATGPSDDSNGGAGALSSTTLAAQVLPTMGHEGRTMPAAAISASYGHGHQPDGRYSELGVTAPATSYRGGAGGGDCGGWVASRSPLSGMATLASAAEKIREEG